MILARETQENNISPKDLSCMLRSVIRYGHTEIVKILANDERIDPSKIKTNCYYVTQEYGTKQSAIEMDELV